MNIRSITLDIKSRLKIDRDFKLLLLVSTFTGVASGIYTPIFANYLSGVYHLTEAQRGMVEFPRELPGATIMLVLSFIAFLGDIRLAAFGMIAASLGLVGMGLLAPTFGFMILWLVVYSYGQHIVMPLIPSIGMSLSDPKEYGKRLGLYSAYGLFATLFGYAVVGLGFWLFHMSYDVAFIIAAVFYMFAAIILLKMDKPKAEKKKVRFFLHKRYTLYYILSMTNGGRKQVFLTFAPWVLITIFNLGPIWFSMLGFIIAIISIATRTLVGKAIDKLGERFVLSCEAALMFVICFGYMFSSNLFSKGVAVFIMCACYVIDSSMSVVEMARSTYVRKISVNPEDVTPTLSAGLSIDHIVAMSIPILGGLLWTATGSYQAVFAVAAGIAILNFFLSTKIKIPTINHNEK